jgi:hypothetical protein
MTPAWTLRAWPPVYRCAGQPLPDAFEHRSTRIFDDGADTAHRTGQTMWVWPGDDGDVGVAWDWVQVAHGIVSMRDPMSVLTNMKLLGDSGEVLTAWQAARHLNEIVFMLPWQHEVRRALDRHEPREGHPSPPRVLGWTDIGTACLAASRQ